MEAGRLSLAILMTIPVIRRIIEIPAHQIIITHTTQRIEVGLSQTLLKCFSRRGGEDDEGSIIFTMYIRILYNTMCNTHVQKIFISEL